MIALLMMVAMAANNDPTDWKCADPLISKNFSRNIKSRALAARIRDECSKPFAPHADYAASTQITEQSIYMATSITYLIEIQNKIDALRRKRDIPLLR